MPVERIRRFLREPASDSFEGLALDAFAFQYQRVEPFRLLCDRRGATPSQVSDWRQIPAIPTSAFRTIELAAAPAEVVFRSSGTTGGKRSVHHQPYPELYREVIDASFPEAVLPRGGRPAILALVPPLDELPDSSLSFMVDHVVHKFGGPASEYALGRGGVRGKAVRAWLAARQRDAQPALVMATSFALASLLEALERFDLRFRLPAGSRVFDTGGFKGRTRELERSNLLERLEERLAVPPTRVVREYGMTELTSQFYTRPGSGAEADVFRGPHWVASRVLDPVSLEPVDAGETGLIAVLDLGNVGSTVHVLTEDLGRAHPDGGFELVGRAEGAELRGCSLTVEELEG